MQKLIESFIENIGEALAIANDALINPAEHAIHNVVICGMGGSGIGGRMVSLWVQQEIEVPVQSFHDYTCPAFVGKNTLFIASSYSGNTEETLECLEQAAAKGAMIKAVCSGGQLEELSAQNGWDCVIVPGGNPPRTALAFSVVQVLNILHQVGLISDVSLKSIESSVKLLNENLPEIHDQAKKMATHLQGKVPVVYTAAKYEAIAVRTRQQLNENAKTLCWHHVIPEMNHNELVGWGGGDSRFSVVYFDTHDLIPRNQKRVEITLDVISKKAPVLVIPARGENFIERSIYMIHLVDWASFYLAELNQTDAIEIRVIDFLKNELANF